MRKKWDNAINGSDGSIHLPVPGMETLRTHTPGPRGLHLAWFERGNLRPVRVQPHDSH